MNNPFTPLSDEELEQLDEFLLDRFDENEDYIDKDEGVIDLSELDGFFTAIVSGPVMIAPSLWLPALWAEVEPVWQSEQEFQHIFDLLIRYMSSIAEHLIDQPESYEPLFLERVVDGKTFTIVDEWCEGYMRGVALSEEDWKLNELDMQILITPVRAFQGDRATQTHEKFNHEEIVNLQKAITQNIREIHAYWLAKRQAVAPDKLPIKRGEAKVGRNQACPCGSGKKFKKCCLH